MKIPWNAAKSELGNSFDRFELRHGPLHSYFWGCFPEHNLTLTWKYFIYVGIGNAEDLSCGCGSPVFFSMLEVVASHVGKWGRGVVKDQNMRTETVYGAEYSTLCGTSLYNSNSFSANTIKPKMIGAESS